MPFAANLRQKRTNQLVMLRKASSFAGQCQGPALYCAHYGSPKGGGGRDPHRTMSSYTTGLPHLYSHVRALAAPAGYLYLEYVPGGHSPGQESKRYELLASR